MKNEETQELELQEAPLKKEMALCEQPTTENKEDSAPCCTPVNKKRDRVCYTEDGSDSRIVPDGAGCPDGYPDC